MARIESLNIMLDPSGKDLLIEKYAGVIENIQKNTLFSTLGNKEMSGSPDAGTFEFKRFANTNSKEYGTARKGGKGESVKVKPVTVSVSENRELINEVEQKDVSLYGVSDLISRETLSNQKSMIRELERAFFAEASKVATDVDVNGANAQDSAELLIQSLETVKNDYVDGVERDEIHVICDVKTYGELRKYLNENVYNANVDSSAGLFSVLNGVKFASSVYLPTNVKMIAMRQGAVGMPVLPTVSNPANIPLSNAISFGLFYSYGVSAISPDLIFKVTEKTAVK